MISKLLKNEIFNFPVEIVYSSSPIELKKQFKKFRLDIDHPDYNFDATDGTFFYDNEIQVGYLFLSKKDMDIIAHECLHIVTQLCTSCGIPISLENDETMAYLLGWYIREVSKIVKPSQITRIKKKKC